MKNLTKKEITNIEEGGLAAVYNMYIDEDAKLRRAAEYIAKKHDYDLDYFYEIFNIYADRGATWAEDLDFMDYIITVVKEEKELSDYVDKIIKEAAERLKSKYTE